MLTGDFNQLAPVCDRVENVNYKESLALFELCDSNRLSKCRRSDDKLFNLCKFEIINTINNLKLLILLIPRLYIKSLVLSIYILLITNTY